MHVPPLCSCLLLSFLAVAGAETRCPGKSCTAHAQELVEATALHPRHYCHTAQHRHPHIHVHASPEDNREYSTWIVQLLPRGHK